VSGTVEYASDVVLFKVNPTTGVLTNTKKNVMNFGLSPYFSTSIDGMDSKGTYLRFKQLVASSSFRGFYYYRSTINPTTGTLGELNYFWTDDDYSQAESSVFSDSLTAQLNALGAPNATIMIARNGTSLFDCSQYTSAFCRDDLRRIWMHSSGAYVFTYDATLNETLILYISLVRSDLEASGATIPGQRDQMAFSKEVKMGCWCMRSKARKS
jgi:hypothetical protein